uniref:Anaphase-promoting complex subunit 4 WD40 domain-containing protein n=1 Tax=Phaeomonas parva TaxID=124430 RepID=A0A7S1TU37_9STRA
MNDLYSPTSFGPSMGAPAPARSSFSAPAASTDVSDLYAGAFGQQAVGSAPAPASSFSAPAPAPVSSRGGRTGRRGHSTNTTPNTAAAGVVASTGISDGCIRLWDLADGAARRVIPAFQAGVDDVALHPDGAHCVAVGSDRETLFRGAIKVFDAQSGALVRRMRQLHGGLARSVVISDCGGFVLSSSDEATLNILVHDFRSGELLHALEGHSAHVRQLCVQGALLASVSHDRTVRVWRWREGTCAEVLSQLPESASACVQMDQSACGKARVRVGDGVCMGAGGRWIANTTTTTLPEERRAKVPKPPPVTIPGAGAAGASPPPSPPELVATDSEASSLASPSSFLDDEHSPSRAQRGADRRAASDADLYYDAYDTEDSSDGEEEDDDADLSADETELFEVLGEKPRARRRSHSIIHGWARFSHHSL